MDLSGRSVLAHVIERCFLISGVQEVCCAVPLGSRHDAVEKEARFNGADVFRGSETDVLDRYWRAAKAVKADVVLRITSDCPLIDPDLSEKVLGLIDDGFEYACNNVPPSWPHGVDCEAFPIDILERAARSAKEPHDREHVTPWMRRNTQLRKASILGPGGWAARQRWTLDYPEDLEFFRALFSLSDVSANRMSCKELLTFLRAHPEVSLLNNDRVISREINSLMAAGFITRQTAS